MRIGFVGAGKVGKAFGWYLKENGFLISGYYSRTILSSELAAKVTGTIAYTKSSNLIDESDILFITTQDGNIEEVSNHLSKLSGLDNKIFIHMSGAYSSNILKKLKEKKCYCFSLHPLQVFSDFENSKKNLSQCYFSLEGDEEKLYLVENILKKLGNKYFIIKEDSKTLYHAAACAFSNYITSVMWIGEELINLAGIESDEKINAFSNLIRGAVDNCIEFGSENALTGPISRGDSETILKHLSSISDDSLKKRYKNLGEITLELASLNKLNDLKKINELKNILGDVKNEK